MTKHSFKSILKVEIKDSLFYTLTTIITQLGNFLIIPLFWKELTPSDYGVIAIVEIVSIFLTAILGLSLDQSITRFYYEWPELERKRRLGGIWVMSWTSSVAMGSVAGLVLFLIGQQAFPEVPFFPIMFLGLVNTALVSLTTVVQTTVRIKRLPKLYMGYRVAMFVLQVSCTSYFVLFMKKGVAGYFTGLVLGSTFMAVISTAIMAAFATPTLRNAGIRESLLFSVPMIPSALLSAGTSVLDRVILKNFCSLETLGIYSLATKFASLITVIQNSLKLSYGPFFMKNINKENGQDIIYRIAGYYIYPIFLAGLILCLFVDNVIVLMNQPSYYPIVEYIPYVVLISIMASLNVFYANGIILSNKTHLMSIPAGIQLAILLSGILLIPKYGVYGIIIAKAISVFAFVAVSILISNRVYKIKYNWSKLILFSILTLAGIIINNIFATGHGLLDIAINSGVLTGFLVLSGLSMVQDFRRNSQQNFVV